MSLVSRSREQAIKEQKENEEFGSWYSYLANPEEVTCANVHTFQKWSQSFKLIYGLFYSKTVNSREEFSSLLVFASPW